MRGELLKVTMREPVEVARSIWDDARSAITGVRDLIQRAERDDLRVRVHPRDLFQIERFLSLQVRRIQLSLFATTMALITAVIYLAIPSLWILAGGLIVAFLFFLVALVLPTHLLENPLRHARGIGMDVGRVGRRE
jgi:Flp pilus assembly protein TadB